MMQMTMVWGGKCIVVMIRPGDASEKTALRNAVLDAALRYGVSDTTYRWTSASSANEKFSAWNTASSDLFRELLRKRKEGDIYFRVYYRPCGGVSTVMPEGDYFREI